jgi:hypothetical protein
MGTNKVFETLIIFNHPTYLIAQEFINIINNNFFSNICSYICLSYHIFWNWDFSASWGLLRSYLNERVMALVYKTVTNGCGNLLC